MEDENNGEKDNAEKPVDSDTKYWRIVEEDKRPETNIFYLRERKSKEYRAKRKRSGIVVAGLVASLGLLGYGTWHHLNIYSKLEEGSVYCSHNLIPDFAVRWLLTSENMFEKNMDTNGNARYESVQIYKDDLGKIVCREFRKDGSKGEPKPF